MSGAGSVRVILADDEEVILVALRQLLEASGFDVVGTASDGVAAADLARELHPDVLVADHRMPGMTGIELAVLLRTSVPGLPVIILSAYDDASLQLEAEQVPVSAYLVKGCSSRDIFQALREAAAGTDPRSLQ
jgi:DNA-binding NarL/FixJ family response regulator